MNSFFDGTEFAPQTAQRSARTAQPRPVRSVQATPLISAVMDCSGCWVGECKSPQMEPYGKGEMRIMLVGYAPDEREDQQGRPFCGPMGQFIKAQLNGVSIDLPHDCIATNVVQCWSASPTIQQVRNCHHRLENQIRANKPGLILTFGLQPARSVLQAPFTLDLEQVQGKIWPCRHYDCWVGCLPDPLSCIRKDVVDEQRASDFAHMLRNIFEAYLSAEWPEEPKIEFTTIRDQRELDNAVQDILASGAMNLDWETTTLSPFDEGADILSLSITTSQHSYFIPFRYFDQTDSAFRQSLIRLLESDNQKSIQNAQFEWLWGRNHLNIEIKNVVHDSMLGAHILDERKRGTSLEYLSFERWGTRHKQEVDRKHLDQLSEEELGRYNVADTWTSFHLSREQFKRMHREDQIDPYRFFHEANYWMMRLKESGIRVDPERVKEISSVNQRNMKQFKRQIENLDCVRRYRTEVPDFNYGSADQLRDFMFRFLGVQATKKTTKGQQDSTDAEVMKGIRDLGGEAGEFAKLLLAIKSGEKIEGTYLKNFLELSDNRHLLHPSFNLHNITTYRSGAVSPNPQNIPKRDPQQSIVRRALVPKLDFFIEADYKAAEVKVIGMYSQDRTLIDYIKTGYDMHQQWAAKIYGVSLADVQKADRSKAKTYWVFPEFYGAYWGSCARAFKELGRNNRFFENLDREFWREFSGVKAWQNELLASYERNHYVETFLKFRRRCPVERNKIINFPIQATAFHLLLDGVVRVCKRLEAARMKSHPVAQVHDSILIDTDADEIEDVIEILQDCMTSKRFVWERDVPMEIEMEIGRDWHTLVELNPADVDGSIRLLDKKLDVVEQQMADARNLLDSQHEESEEED